MVPRLRATAVGVDSSAARMFEDSVRSSALDDQSGLRSEWSGLDHGGRHWTVESCAPCVGPRTNRTYLLTSTFAEPAEGQGCGLLLSVDDLLLDTDATGPLVAFNERGLRSAGRLLRGPGGSDDPARRPTPSASGERNRVLIKRPR